MSKIMHKKYVPTVDLIDCGLRIKFKSMECPETDAEREYMHSFARLVSMAPEMLAMLEAIESQGSVAFANTRMGSLRALIRKVKGGTNGL